MKSEESSPGASPNPPCKGIVLQTPRGSHVPSFKNAKRAIKDSRTGKLRTLTEPETKQWMERCIQSFVAQLNSGSAMLGEETQMVRFQQSSIALLRLLRGLDDSIHWIPEIQIKAERCDKGEEGAEIIIERIQ